MPILKPNTIITPHVKEFRRWIVDWLTILPIGETKATGNTTYNSGGA